MTVSELIAALQEHDGNLPVWVEALDVYPVTECGLDPGIDDIIPAVLLVADTTEV
jgi:hypothetical protein